MFNIAHITFLFLIRNNHNNNNTLILFHIPLNNIHNNIVHYLDDIHENIP